MSQFRILAENLSARQHALSMTSVLALILWLGIAAAIALAAVVLWLVAELALLTLQAIVECAGTISSTFSAADPFTRLLIIAALAYVAYRLGKRLARRKP